MNSLLKSLAKGMPVAAIAATIVTAPAHALTITQYTFGPDGTTPITTPTTTAPNTSSGSISGGSGGNFIPTNFGGVNYVNYDTFTPIGSSTSAIANNAFITFTVNPTGGSRLNLNFLSVSARDSVSPSGANIFLRSSVDSFATNIGIIQPVVNAFPSGFSTNTFSLTAPAFQNLTGPISFRLYAYNNTAGRTSYDFDNVTLDGTVATPIPFAFSPVPGLVFAWGVRSMRRKLKGEKQTEAVTVEA